MAVPSVGDPFFSAVMRGVRRAATARGYTVFIRETREKPLTNDEINSILGSKQADGLVLLNNMTYVVGPLDTTSNPLGRPPVIHVDNVAASRAMTEHLLRLGHRRIALIFSGLKPSFVDRERGFRQAMREAGLSIGEDCVVDTENTLDGARSATRQLLSLASQPTAVFCASDELALGCMHELRAAGLRVPADVSVAGFDDTRYAAVSNPPLTTIRQPAEEMGVYVVDELCHSLEGDAAGNRKAVVVPHELIVRGSVAACPER